MVLALLTLGGNYTHMVSASAGSRVYMVYQHSLFAEGIRSLLRNQPAIQIVGAETDTMKAFNEVRSLKPSVVLIEESTTDPEQSVTWDLLHRQGAGRVVALNLNHNAATVYDRESVPISTPADLLHAVQGYPRFPVPDEATARPGRGSRPQAASRAKASIPKGKTEPRKGRA